MASACNRTPLFFAKKDVGLALADIVGLLGVLAATTVEFGKVPGDMLSSVCSPAASCHISSCFQFACCCSHCLRRINRVLALPPRRSTPQRPI